LKFVARRKSGLMSFSCKIPGLGVSNTCLRCAQRSCLETLCVSIFFGLKRKAVVGIATRDVVTVIVYLEISW
jgi:hypothetical protein